MVPRMSEAAWASIVQITGKVVDKVGNILFPVLIIIVTAVIIKSFATLITIDWVEPSYNQNPVIYGFLQGYATADLQCALVFGVIVVDGIRNTGITDKSINKNLIKIGAVGLGLLGTGWRSALHDNLTQHIVLHGCQ